MEKKNRTQTKIKNKSGKNPQERYNTLSQQEINEIVGTSSQTNSNAFLSTSQKTTRDNNNVFNKNLP